ncbi:MAG: zinc-dependent alcohol dehydrogenase [Acidobacteria bacterium]|nr:zinc-dependent alcohol dehydrogenase [Acidobacteriota bacterium]
MKAIVIEEFQKPLALRDLPAPHLRTPFDVIVRIEASGVCHTDLHAASGDWSSKPALPLIPGHEGVGRVVEAGEMAVLSVGDRVGIPFLHSSCGACEYCLGGNENLCPAQQMTGFTVPGCHAEFVAADSRFTVKIPDALDSNEIAPHFCAGVTTYRAVKISGAAPDKTVLISGFGGLGHFALQYARLTGARTIVVDVSEEKLEAARRLGADATINASETDVPRAVRKLGGADIVIGAAASSKALRGAFDALKRGGRLVVVGLPPDDLAVPVFNLVVKGVGITGSYLGTRKDLREVIDLAARGRIKCEYTTAKLEDINDVFDEMKAGRIQGRVVLKI